MITFERHDISYTWIHSHMGTFRSAQSFLRKCFLFEPSLGNRHKCTLEDDLRANWFCWSLTSLHQNRHLTRYEQENLSFLIFLRRIQP